MDGEKLGIGVAFDVGTTTIAGSSVDLSTGRVLGTVSMANPQSRWGRDVLSRINAVAQDERILKELSLSVIAACNSIMGELDAGPDFTVITAAGNPVMTHILLNVSPLPLSRVPYKPAFTEAKRIDARAAGFAVKEGTLLYTLPFIGGFVGGDAVAVLLSLGMNGTGAPALAIDIGTNSEIMLSAGGGIYATSAAAGPAFEGGELEYGMTAGKGAIRGVEIKGEKVALDVIGSSSPVGICGSGLIDAASELLRAGVMDRTGRIRDRDEITDNLSSRIREAEAGNSFVLYRGAKGEVTLSQGDIRALQTAKSATRAGIIMLLNKARITPSAVERVYIAGAFGSNIKKEGLAEIGLLDREWLGKVTPVGDAALEGAILALTEEKRREAEEIAAKARYVSLSGSAHFQREFIANMNF